MDSLPKADMCIALIFSTILPSAAAFDYFLESVASFPFRHQTQDHHGE
jgi:hypothetical protein